MGRRKQPKLLTLAILTTLTVLTWVSFEVWRAFTKEAPVPVDSQILKPLDPSLDIQALEKLKGEIYLPDSEARRGAAAAAVSTPAASPTLAPSASPTPTATTGASTQ